MDEIVSNTILVCPKKNNFSRLLKPVSMWSTNQALRPATVESHAKVLSIFDLENTTSIHIFNVVQILVAR